MIRFIFGCLFSYALAAIVLDRCDPQTIALVALVPYTIGWFLRRFCE